MSGQKTRTSRVLLLASILLCLIAGLSVPQSSTNRSSDRHLGETDMYVAGDLQETSSSSSQNEEKPDPEGNTPSPEETAAPTASPAPTPESQPAYEVSPEASVGIWRPEGSKWRFLVDGTPYTGWLNDTDGHRYYFDSDGIMKTGVLDYENKRYYFDEDGIMQTGNVEVNGKTYHFLEDGSLEGYDVAEAKKAREAKKAKEAQAKKEAQESEAAGN